ncbi:methyltransferase domain-containing protein [Marinactinospora rubrisoli]|uniref:Protein-L-isoaspartate O-methyltransferase n=1 Tax=Marinactinospora rubrisoli TaxID=2715399 RepID=A0ABW2KAY0_9ACTN
MASPGPDDLAVLARSPEWAAAFREVPREYFIPDVAEASFMTGEPSRWIDRRADPDDWRAAVYADSTILTQIDDGNTPLTEETYRPGLTLPSSSNSAPSLVARLLHLLDPYPGDRVLEIGTGTGWTAALLAARLGDGNVTTVEIDPAVAESAAQNLKRVDLAPNVIVADGTGGWPDGAPYDRVHVTCGVASIPYAWVAQTRPGGVLVMPWMHEGRGGGHTVALTVTGEEAVGRFHGLNAYMMLRGQREPMRSIDGEDRESTGTVDPRRIARGGPGLTLALAGLLPNVRIFAEEDARTDGSVRGVARERAPGESWARVDYWPAEHRSEVVQTGPRNLWDEVEAGYLTWLRWGAPSEERFGLAVTPDGQYVWLDRPDNRLDGE